MKCPKCGSWKSKVVDVRNVQEYTAKRRRRECKDCQNRYNTIEYSLEQLANFVKTCKETI
jgi:transcriptional repressor NrdR